MGMVLGVRTRLEKVECCSEMGEAMTFAPMSVMWKMIIAPDFTSIIYIISFQLLLKAFFFCSYRAFLAFFCIFL